MYQYGIDVSYANGEINWEKVKDQIDFAILRIGWIGNHNNHQIDDQFERNYSECKRLGIKIGGYVYSYAETSDAIISGANFILEHNQDKFFDMPVYIDLEDKQISDLDMNTQTQNAIDFINYIEDNSDLKGGVYANLNWFKCKLDEDYLIDNNVSLWLAHWNVAPERYANSEYDMLQYGDDGEIDGIDNNVDVNILYCDKIDDDDQDDIDVQDDINIPYKYYNGSTKEIVYADTNGNKEIGFLNPYEICSCLGTVNNRAVVLYSVDNENNKKIGFVKWLGGVKNE